MTTRHHRTGHGIELVLISTSASRLLESEVNFIIYNYDGYHEKKTPPYERLFFIPPSPDLTLGAVARTCRGDAVPEFNR